MLYSTHQSIKKEECNNESRAKSVKSKLDGSSSMQKMRINLIYSKPINPRVSAKY